MIIEVDRSFPEATYEERLRHFLFDGVHPNSAGYQVCPLSNFDSSKFGVVLHGPTH